ncbi:hypothetical protein BC628DRAFT_1344074 [Trametes gibbosa]|nr:hypothetical protein BC628DRAFT_1344074 [Trametes gibbosa]
MGSHSRRRSHSSSSSSSSSDDEEKKSKKHNKHVFPEAQGHGSGHGGAMPMPPPYSAPGHGQPSMPVPGYGAGVPMPSLPVPGGYDAPHMPTPGAHVDYANRDFPQAPIPGAAPGGFPSPGHAPGTPSPGVHAGAAPPSGFRVPLSDAAPFPAAQAGPPACVDADGRTPVYLGSALLGNAVHPCKIVPSLNPPARVAYGGRELEHRGRFDLLPFDAGTMEWVPTAQGQIPVGRRPVEGGYEENGGKLFHALATVNGVRVPGKTGVHLHGANVPFGGREHVVKQDYAILCWRY